MEYYQGKDTCMQKIEEGIAERGAEHRFEDREVAGDGWVGEWVEIYLVQCTMFPCRLLGQERIKLFHKRVSLAILE